jgi:hypothetical protein
VSIRIYDIRGALLATHVVAGAPGRNRFTWDGRTNGGTQSQPGVYFLRLACGGTNSTVRAIVVR